MQSKRQAVTDGTGSSHAMIDWTHVKRLESDVGAGEFRNVVALFLDEVDSEIELLRNTAPAADQIKAKMHFLKGSACYLGFAEFGDLCARNEALADAGDTAAIDLTRLIAVYEQSRRQFVQEASSHCSFTAAA
jgi:HPt (histidine-containing phosphotransfer) domain-containing protein